MAALVLRAVFGDVQTAGGPAPRAIHLSILCLVMSVVAGMLVVIRFVGRWKKRSIGIDDWTISIAYLLSLEYTILQIVCVKHGLGRHAWEVSPEDTMLTLRYLYIIQITYKICLSLIKISFLLLFIRIFYVHRLFCWACYFLMGITMAAGIAFTFPTVFQCRPIRAYWDRSVPHVCIENAAWRVSYALLNVVTDFLILILPIRESLCLLTGTRDKILVIFIFSLGLFCCAVSIIRTTTIFGTSDNKDPLWSVALISVWSAIELSTGIIVACLPMLRQSFFLIFPGASSAMRKAAWSRKEPPRRAGKKIGPSKMGPGYKTQECGCSESACGYEHVSMGAVGSREDHAPDGRTQSQERFAALYG